MDDRIAFENYLNRGSAYDYSESQRDYERQIKKLDIKAKQDPSIARKYNKIKTLEKWYRDSETNFGQQKKTIDLLKSNQIGLNIDHTKFIEIKRRYLAYNKKHRKSYQNMVIIFLAIVWMEIKDTTNIRIEHFIEICKEIGHKINKKMINNATEKLLDTEKKWKKLKSTSEIEKKIKEKIKIVFQKNLNNIPFEQVQDHFKSIDHYNNNKLEMQLLVDDLLNQIDYEDLRNHNYKAFTAGLIYYIAQSLQKEKRKAYTQRIIEEATKFSTTTIRKKYNILKELLGEAKEIK